MTLIHLYSFLTKDILPWCLLTELNTCPFYATYLYKKKVLNEVKLYFSLYHDYYLETKDEYVIY